MQQFQELGELIEKRWRSQNYSEQQFKQIAADALAEANLPLTKQMTIAEVALLQEL